jgi:hypothetical protein
MSTLGELKTRIIAKLNRDDMGSGGDLETVLADAISEAIELHADEQFYFNRGSGSRSTTADVAYVARPTGVRVAKTVSYLGEPLDKVSLDEIEHRTETGLPSRWAENGDNIQLWPIPNAVYSLSVFGTQAITALANDAASNEWTEEGAPLIDAATRVILYRDVLRDDGGEAAATRAETKALSRLRRETRQRERSPLRTDLGAIERFNINRGD